MRFGTGNSNYDEADANYAAMKEREAKREQGDETRGWNEAAAKYKRMEDNREAASHGDPFGPAIGRLTPAIDTAPNVGPVPEELALTEARIVISDTLFELGFVIGTNGRGGERDATTLRMLYKALNKWADEHGLGSFDFPGRNAEDLV